MEFDANSTSVLFYFAYYRNGGSFLEPIFSILHLRRRKISTLLLFYHDQNDHNWLRLKKHALIKKILHFVEKYLFFLIRSILVTLLGSDAIIYFLLA